MNTISWCARIECIVYRQVCTLLHQNPFFKYSRDAKYNRDCPGGQGKGKQMQQVHHSGCPSRQHSLQTSDIGKKYRARWTSGKRTVGSADVGIHTVNYGCIWSHSSHHVFVYWFMYSCIYLVSYLYFTVFQKQFEMSYQVYIQQNLTDRRKPRVKFIHKSTYQHYQRWARNSLASFPPTKAKGETQPDGKFSPSV